MKKFLILALLTALFSACSLENTEPNSNPNNGDDFWCVDWNPLFMKIYVNDAEGNTLLDTSSEHCLDLSKIVVTYKGEEYTIPEQKLSFAPLTYLAIFEGIHLRPGRDGYAPSLYIGEWARDEKWDNCEVKIAWGDGTTDVLSFSHDYTVNPEYYNDPEHDFGYTFYSEWYLNGEPHAGSVYTFVK